MKQAISTAMIVLLMITGSKTDAQITRIGFAGGHGSYSLQDLKSFQHEVGNNPFLPELTKTASFPGYFNFAAFIEFDFKDSTKLIADITYQYSGARSFYADYSGFYRLSMQLNGVRFGLQYRIPIKSGEKWGTHFSVGAGVISSNLNIDEQLEITSVEGFREELSFNSLGFFGEPAVTAHYQVCSRFRIELLIGYEYNVPSLLRWSENRDMSLQNDKREPVRVDWTGVRYRLGVSYAFMRN
jgi:hypothetical protein